MTFIITFSGFFIDIKKWTIGGRYDFYDPEEGTQSNSIDHAVFINYYANESIVLKLEHHMYDLENPGAEDYDHTIGSVVIYLGN